MKWLPYDNFIIDTTLKPAEVELKMRSEIAPSGSRDFTIGYAETDNTYFTGYAENNGFKVMRIIQNRNSFLPVVKGRTENWLNGSRVYIKTRLQLFVAGFMCLWFGGTIVAGLALLMQNILTGKFSSITLMPFGMFIFGYAMTMGFYSYERNKAKDILLELLAGQIVETDV